MDTSTKVNPEITSIKEKFTEVRQWTEKLCFPLKYEDFVVQPMNDASPPKWHLGHTTWFFEMFILQPYLTGYEIFNSQYNYLFNSYYESLGDRMVKTNRGNMSRPSVDEVYEYRKHVDEAMYRLFENHDIFNDHELYHLVVLGLNHEQQHQELLVTDIKYILGNNPLMPAYIESKPPGVSKNQNQHAIKPLYFDNPELYKVYEEGVYSIGHNGNGFCYDNETGCHKTYLHKFRIMNRLITNEEFLAFIQDGGYQNHEFWLSEGWDWIHENNINAPAYWHQDGEGIWHYYTLSGLRILDKKAPVCHISYYEAYAFAQWAGKRLPTEQEWETAFYQTYGTQPLNGTLNQANLLDNNNYQPMSVENPPFPKQMLGDVWEWTQSAYLPYPFYRKPDGALGEYNGKFMINQMVLRGGSCATPKSHIRPTYRNFFHAEKRWQFTGIRLAEHV